jgi:hypothetical protein
MKKKTKTINKILLMIMVLLSSYQVVIGGHGVKQITIWAYTIGFGILVISGLLMIILGYEILDNPLVVFFSSIIPLSIATGLVSQVSDTFSLVYLIIAIIGLVLILISRSVQNSFFGLITLVIVHGVSGLSILLIPIYLVIIGGAQPLFVMISVGGALMGLGGILILLNETKKISIPAQSKAFLLPGILLLTTIFLSVGLSVI